MFRSVVSAGNTFVEDYVKLHVLLHCRITVQVYVTCVRWISGNRKQPRESRGVQGINMHTTWRCKSPGNNDAQELMTISYGTTLTTHVPPSFKGPTGPSPSRLNTSGDLSKGTTRGLLSS